MNRYDEFKFGFVWFMLCWIVATPLLKIFTDLTLLLSIGMGFVIACVLTFGGIIIGDVNFD